MPFLSETLWRACRSSPNLPSPLFSSSSISLSLSVVLFLSLTCTPSRSLSSSTTSHGLNKWLLDDGHVQLEGTQSVPKLWDPSWQAMRWQRRRARPHDLPRLSSRDPWLPRCVKGMVWLPNQWGIRSRRWWTVTHRRNGRSTMEVQIVALNDHFSLLGRHLNLKLVHIN